MLPAEIDEITNKILSRYKAVDTELKRRQRLVMDAPSEERARRRLVDLRKQLAADLKTLEADTRSWIEGDFPGIYTLGASSSAASLGIAASFTQTHREAFSRLAVDTFDDLLTATSFVADDAKRWIRDVAAERTRFVVAGGQTARQGGREMARQLERAVKPISAIRYKDGSLHSIGEYSEVVLRTKTAVAYNTGSLDVFDTAGVAYVEIFDGSDCHLLSHKDGPLANGLIVPATTAREHPIAHPNCIMPGQDFVPVGRLEAIERAWYSGPAATIHATTGTGTHPVTVGPNHPMLTRRGWVLARFLEEGDELAYHGALDATLHAGNEAYLQQVPAIEDAFGAVRSVGASAFVPATRHDLHGDGLWAEGEVEIVRPAGDLLRVTDASAVEHLGEHSLVRANPDDKPLAGESVGDAFLGGDSLAASPCVGRADESTPSSVVETLPAEAHCFTSRPAEPEASELASHGAVSDAVIQGDGLARLPGEVAPGDVLWVELAPSRHAYAPILSVEISHFEGWVFDATTEHGYYLVRAYCASNCRRSFGARPDIESPEDLASAKSTERTPTGFRAAAPRSPEPAVTSGRSSRTPRSQREQRRPRSEASGTAPSTARPAISDIEAAAARHGVTVDEIELHRPAVKELRRAVADEAARTQREAFELLDRSGALRVQRPARIASQRGGEYDWYTGLGDREKARLSRRWFSDSSVDSPDVLADRLRADLGARFASYTDGELMEEVWLPATERIEASGALRQGKLPSLRGYSSSFDVDSLIPELSGQGYSARALLADDLDAAAHIARVNRERFAEEAYRMLGPAANPVEGPGVFEMGFQSWEAEVRDLEHVLQNTRDPARTVLRRYDELVPFDLDAEGLTYEELYARIIETSRLAGKEVSAHAVVPWT